MLKTKKIRIGEDLLGKLIRLKPGVSIHINIHKIHKNKVKGRKLKRFGPLAHLTLFAAPIDLAWPNYL